MGVISDAIKSLWEKLCWAVCEVYQGLVEASKAIGKVFNTIATLLWYARCYSYMIWWRISSVIVRILTLSAIIVLIFASLIVFIEIAMVFFPPKEFILKLPGWLEALVIFFTLWMLYHRLRELKHSKLESKLAIKTPILLRAIAVSNLNSTNTTRNTDLQNFMEVFHETFQSIFEKKGNIELCIMTPNGQTLHVFCAYAKAVKYKSNFTLQLNDSGAGKALQAGEAIYIPAVRYRQGIKISFIDGRNSIAVGGAVIKKKAYTLAQSVYGPSNNPSISDQYKSILCVPIYIGSNIKGVLNIDSPKQNAFGEVDFDIANIASHALTIAFDKYGPPF
jgi:hypothetical protein